MPAFVCDYILVTVVYCFSRGILLCTAWYVLSVILHDRLDISYLFDVNSCKRVSVSCREWTLIKVYNWNHIALMRAQYHLVVGQNKSDVVWNSHQRRHDVHGWAPQFNEHWGAWPGTLDKPMLALLSFDCVVVGLSAVFVKWYNVIYSCIA